MSKGKSVNIFLIDGTPTGKIKCTLQNWTGVAYKIPRSLLETCKDSPTLNKHLKQTGIYFLLGENADSGERFIYIGQASLRKNGEALSIRLQEHKASPEKDYWNEAIVFTTQNDTLGPTEISFLENKFCNLANDAGRYIVKNGNEPNPGNITEEKESEMEEFIEYARIVMGVLGHKVFEPVIKQEEKQQQKPVNSPVFHFRGRFKATAIVTQEGFVVLKGSQISTKLTQSAKGPGVKARSQYKDKITSEGILLEDIPFTSPSAAASFVGGACLSGNECWRTEDGKNPKELNI